MKEAIAKISEINLSLVSLNIPAFTGVIKNIPE
jgi:hypothetical protein